MWTTKFNALSKTVMYACLLVPLTLAGGCGWLETTSEGAEVDSGRRPTASTLYSMSRILAAQGRSEEAAFVLNRILWEYPEFRPAYSDLADLHLRAGRGDQAVQLLTAALDRWPNDHVLHNNLGMCHIASNNIEQALDRFIRASELAPQVHSYRANHAAALGLMGQYDQALAAYQQFLSLGEAHYNLAVLAESRGDTDLAQHHYSQAQAHGYKQK